MLTYPQWRRMERVRRAAEILAVSAGISWVLVVIYRLLMQGE